MSIISSRDNPRVRRWRALARDARERRKEGRVLIEGAHLVAACLDAGGRLEELILDKDAAATSGALVKRWGKSPTILDSRVFKAISGTETPTGIVAEIAIPARRQDLKLAQACVLLEAIQDSGNVGAILRSAAAFGIRHAVLGKGCADAWSPKVLRAGAGAHFSLQVTESADLVEAMTQFAGRIVCTVPRGGIAISDADLSGRIGWIFGAEGQGVSDALAAQATLRVSIPMSRSTESINVAAAAAICFHQSSLA